MPTHTYTYYHAPSRTYAHVVAVSRTDAQHMLRGTQGLQYVGADIDMPGPDGWAPGIGLVTDRARDAIQSRKGA